MKKILLGIDGVGLGKGPLDFASYLGRLTKSPITGVFLENIEVEEEPVMKRNLTKNYVDWEADEYTEEYKSKMELIQLNIDRFKEGCIAREVECNVHRDRGLPGRELVEESRFADVLVIDPETAFSKRHEEAPTEFIKKILAKSECPIFVAPERFDTVDEIVFTYAESPSAFFAIKQFTYLFPEMRHKKVSLLHVDKSGYWQQDIKVKLEEWFKIYYSNYVFETIKGNEKGELADYLFQRKNMILVMGAYGRNAVSMFFNHSQADLIIRETSQPIFISHI